MERKITLNVEGKELHLVLGKKYGDWIAECDEDCWDFPIEEMLDGTVEINEDIWYWLISGRCFETYEEV